MNVTTCGGLILTRESCSRSAYPGDRSHTVKRGHSDRKEIPFGDVFKLDDFPRNSPHFKGHVWIVAAGRQCALMPCMRSAVGGSDEHGMGLRDLRAHAISRTLIVRSRGWISASLADLMATTTKSRLRDRLAF